MHDFIIKGGKNWFSETRKNPIVRMHDVFLKEENFGYYHSDYFGGGNWQVQGSIENMIWTLKNDVSPFPHRIEYAKLQLAQILKKDLPQILIESGLKNLTVCVIPRSKNENYYRNDQLFFRKIVSNVSEELNNFYDGSKYIIRHTNTRTTHLDRNGEGGDGHLPYPGITIDTCNISPEVVNKDILLIDDLYTENVNIDEDAIQALLDKGAKSVVFYSVGKTVFRNYNTKPIIIVPFSDNDALPF